MRFVGDVLVPLETATYVGLHISRHYFLGWISYQRTGMLSPVIGYQSSSQRLGAWNIILTTLVAQVAEVASRSETAR